MNDIKRNYIIELSKTTVGVDFYSRQSTMKEFDMLYKYLRSVKEPFTFTTCTQIIEVDMAILYTIKIHKDVYCKFLDYVFNVAYENKATFYKITEEGGV